MESLEAAMLRVVAGDIGCPSSVLTADHSKLQEAAEKLGPLCVSRLAVSNVVRTWRSGKFSAEDVQRWASFVRRGYVGGAAVSPIRPISILYDAQDEELIVETIGRLDEIGDLIGGHVDDEEQKQLIQALEG